MPDTIAEQAKRALKKSGKLTFDPATFMEGFAAGVAAASQMVRDALDKYVGRDGKA